MYNISGGIKTQHGNKYDSIYDPKKAKVVFFDTSKNNLFNPITLEGNALLIKESYIVTIFVILMIFQMMMM